MKKRLVPSEKRKKGNKKKEIKEEEKKIEEDDTRKYTHSATATSPRPFFLSLFFFLSFFLFWQQDVTIRCDSLRAFLSQTIAVLREKERKRRLAPERRSEKERKGKRKEKRGR